MSNVHLGKKSQELLNQVHPDLRKVLEEAFKSMPFDITVLPSTIRTVEEQRKNVEKGVSWTMKSKHLDGRAVDIAPYPVDWNNLERFVVMAAHVLAAADKLGIRVVWGGTWAPTTEGWQKNKRFDGPHFEI
ncbi:putative endolysin [Salmonella phage 7-11]|uniref:Putative endolysin n=1 Tax=Salmonella phage 7-11 TaxID=1054968 RepID=G0X4Y3_9CAUD|nr:endolysin [Salmonella phage 7-11]AEK81965.1 putative endolysin [Salmonella phage 7-11]